MRFNAMTKKLITLCLAVALVFAMAVPAFAYSTDYPNTWSNTGDQRYDVVQIAKTQVGYGEVNYETKYGAWWTQYNGNSFNFLTQPWCAMFMLWCENQAGCTNAVYGMSASSSALLKAYQNGINGAQAYSFGSGYMPRPGDIIFVGYYGGDSTNHVGLVVGVDDSTIYTIEGNSAGDRVCNVSYSLSTGCRRNSSRAIVWFGVPNYSNDSSAAFNGPVSETVTEESIDMTEVNYTTVVTGDVLNVRSLPTSGATVKSSVLQGTSVNIVAEAKGSNGHLWGKLSGGGWICLAYTVVGDYGHNYSGDYTKLPETGSSGSQSAPAADAIICKGTVSASTLNIRSSASTSSEIIGTLKKDQTVSIVAVENNGGTEWGKLTTGGWISMKYVSGASTGNSSASSSSSVSKTGVITADLLNVRQTPSTGKVVATIANGETVTVTETMSVDGGLWGKISSGWISMNYFKETSSSQSSSQAAAASSSTITGVVTANHLNVRSEAGVGEVMASLSKGETVSISETKSVDGVLWGKTSAGWVCMSYIGTGSESGSSSQSSSTTISGTVTADLLYVRSEPVTGSIVDSIPNGASVTVTEAKTVNGSVWGKVSRGWIAMQYVNTSAQASVSAQPELNGKVTEATSDSLPGIRTVVVTGDRVNIRTGAGSSYPVEIVACQGQTFVIYEVASADGASWGHIENGGWICLSYTKNA